MSRIVITRARPMYNKENDLKFLNLFESKPVVSIVWGGGTSTRLELVACRFITRDRYAVICG